MKIMLLNNIVSLKCKRYRSPLVSPAAEKNLNAVLKLNEGALKIT